ncbi:hypothetical protein P5673_022653 [Acropora cervicornis]|uniref:Uncharacterized protein n=1 Tax=Acropora cervicornis TaxID=6130 RepID=A0AAD9Q6I3_ACRCE|nr:hypothetical protein P5673_022653 [Acropora cervicornis]
MRWQLKKTAELEWIMSHVLLNHNSTLVISTSLKETYQNIPANAQNEQRNGYVEQKTIQCTEYHRFLYYVTADQSRPIKKRAEDKVRSKIH